MEEKEFIENMIWKAKGGDNETDIRRGLKG